MSLISLSELWEQAEEASSLEAQYSYDDASGSSADRADDEEDCWGQSVLLREASLVQSTMIRLEDGDIHLCDSSCPYAVAEKDGDLVCPLSGRVVSHLAVERTDFSTGRSTWSADPDMQGGGANGNTAWRKKIDKVSASKQANRLSEQINDSEMPTAKTFKSKGMQVKRGALCVDEKMEPNATPRKRARMSKKRVENNEQVVNMVAEASSIFAKLMTAKRKPSAPSSEETPQNNASAGSSRLADPVYLFDSALKKYCKEVAERRSLPCLNEIHNIRLAVDSIVKREATRRCDSEKHADAMFRSIHFREIASRLAVSLWRAVCSTPYMGKIKRSGDSFRPFCVGVFYSMKRGLCASDGTVLVPCLPGFQHAFPTQREIANHLPTKALHASSHRGLCSIHRAIASLSVDEQSAVFAPCVRIVEELRRVC